MNELAGRVDDEAQKLDGIEYPAQPRTLTQPYHEIFRKPRVPRGVSISCTGANEQMFQRLARKNSVRVCKCLCHAAASV